MARKLTYDGSTVVRRGYGELTDVFTQKNLSNCIVDACGTVFIDGARKARDVVNRMSIRHNELTEYIGKMPPRYRNLIKPQEVKL